MHLGVVQHEQIACQHTHSLKNVLVYTSVAEWLQMSPIEGRLSSPRTAAEQYHIGLVWFRECRDWLSVSNFMAEKHLGG